MYNLYKDLSMCGELLFDDNGDAIDFTDDDTVDCDENLLFVKSFATKSEAVKYGKNLLKEAEVRYRDINNRLDDIEKEVTEIFKKDIDAPIPEDINKEYEMLERELPRNKDYRNNLTFTVRKKRERDVYVD